MRLVIDIDPLQHPATVSSFSLFLGESSDIGPIAGGVGGGVVVLLLLVVGVLYWRYRQNRGSKKSKIGFICHLAAYWIIIQCLMQVLCQVLGNKLIILNLNHVNLLFLMDMCVSVC